MDHKLDIQKSDSLHCRWGRDGKVLTGKISRRPVCTDLLFHG